MGDARITLGQLQAIYGLPTGREGEPDSLDRAAAYEEAAHNWAAKEILIQEARRRRLDQDSLFLARTGNISRELLIALLYERACSQVEVDSTEVLAEHRAHHLEYISAADQIDLAYVLAPARELAHRARRSLLEGMNMQEVLALDESLTGAVVGWIRSEDLNPQIAKAAFLLLPGGVSYPQKLENGGYILLQCRQRRLKGTMLPVEEVYEEIYQRVLQQKRLQAEKELRDSLWTTYQPEILVGSSAKRDLQDK